MSGIDIQPMASHAFFSRRGPASNKKSKLAFCIERGGGTTSLNSTADIHNLMLEHHSEGDKLNFTNTRHLNNHIHDSFIENRRRYSKKGKKSSKKKVIARTDPTTTKQSSHIATKQHHKKLTKAKAILKQGDRYNECLRRIKREWKDAVQLGIAYDWVHKETLTPKGRSPSGYNKPGSMLPVNSTQKEEPTKTLEDIDQTFFKYNYIRIGPMGKNLLRWHFSILGPPNSVYERGIYHGVILLPRDYPGSPPRIQLLTPSGRFIPNTDICLSASAHHPETWTPRWTILSLVDALRIHMLSTPNEIGGMHATSEARREYAASSRCWPLHRYMISVGIFSTNIPIDSGSIQRRDELLNPSRINSHRRHMIPAITTWKRTTIRLMSLLTAFIFLFFLRWV